MTQPINPESSDEQTDAEIQENCSLNETESVPEEELDELATAKFEIDRLSQEVRGLQDKYLRSLAEFDNFKKKDFENYKKRAQKERSDLLKYQGEAIIIDLIRVVDDLDLAMQSDQGQVAQGRAIEGQPDSFRRGIELIYNSFCEVLNKWEIRSESALGQAFDPVKHLAISKVFIEGETPGQVVSELRKVFFYKDKIIRVAEVVVAAEPPTGE